MAVINWLAVAAWAHLIYYFSSIPGFDIGLGLWDFAIRKSAHIFEFGYLAVLLYLAFGSVLKLRAEKIITLAAVCAFFYAVSDEFHQTFVTNRHGDPADVLIDSIGISLVIYLIIRKRGSRERTAPKTG